MSKEEKFENEVESKGYKITFENRKRSLNIKKILVLVGRIISIITLGYILSEVRIYIKYGDVIEYIELNQDNGMVINDYSQLIDTVEKSIVTISEDKENLSEPYTNNDNYANYNTSGVIVDKNGYIITNYTSIKNYDDIFIKIPFSENEYIEGTVFTINEELDLAVIKIETDEELTPIKIADFNSSTIGQEVIVIGNTIARDKLGYASLGVVTSINEIHEYGEYLHAAIELNAIVNEKNVGGAICNTAGELIGIANKVNIDGVQVGYGITVNKIGVMIESGSYINERLGVIEGGITNGDEDEYLGFYIKQLNKNSNAYKSGLRPTDIIKSINGIHIKRIEDLVMILRGVEVEDTLECSIIRDGEVTAIDIKILE